MEAKNPHKLTKAQSIAIADKLAVLLFDFWQNRKLTVKSDEPTGYAVYTKKLTRKAYEYKN